MIDPATSVVFDINVYLDYILGDDGSWPLLPDVPPTTENPAADAVSLAFAARFRLFTSPHILRGVSCSGVAWVRSVVGSGRGDEDLRRRNIPYFSLILWR